MVHQISPQLQPDELGVKRHHHHPYHIGPYPDPWMEESDYMKNKNGMRQHEHDNYPLFDFAIVGFEKCGTTMLHDALGNIPGQSWIKKSEDHRLEFGGEYAKLKTSIFNSTIDVTNMKRNFIDQFVLNAMPMKGKMSKDGKQRRILTGFKSPDFFQSGFAIQRMDTIMPNLSMIVVTRHPVHMFESFFNYRFAETRGHEGRHANDLIGACDRDCHLLNKDSCVESSENGVCTDKANYHHSLSRLNLTPMTSDDELDLLDHTRQVMSQNFTGKILLLEEHQLRDDNADRYDKLQRDVQSFLGFEEGIMSWNVTKRANDSSKAIRKSHKIKICHDHNRQARQTLVESGKKAAEWIEKYLLHSSRAHVTNRDHFLELISKWKYDPCIDDPYS